MIFGPGMKLCPQGDYLWQSKKGITYESLVFYIRFRLRPAEKSVFIFSGGTSGWMEWQEARR